LRRYKIIAILAFFICMVPVHVFPGTFRAIPVRLSLDDNSKTTVLKIVNEGDEKVTIQLDAKGWQQDETGKDVYEETQDIVFFPRIVQIEKGKERVIRIGYTGKPDTTEKTYRLIMQELPVEKAGEMRLRLTLTLTIPIFVKPKKEIQEWSAEEAGLSEESLKVKVSNSGNSHIIVSRIKASGLDESGSEVFSRDEAGWYTLAGRSKIFSISVPHEECLKARTIRVKAALEAAQDKEKVGREFALDVKKEMCTRKPENQTERKKTVGPRGDKTPQQ
jgi:fimbrial chaperone protein